MTLPSGLNFNDPRVVLAQYPSWETAHPQKGESKVYVGSRVEDVPRTYLYLASTFYITEGTSKWYTDGQLVKVRMRRDGYAYLDAPIARTFHAPGILFNVPVEVGRTYSGTGILGLTFAAEGVVRDWVVPDGWSGAKGLDWQACTRMTFPTPVVVGQPTNPEAYGVGFNQCTHIETNGIETRGCRHPLVLWGVARSYFRNTRHMSPSGPSGLDFAHGFVEDVVHDGGDGGDRNGAVGNRWDAPCRNVTITGIRNARDLLVYSGSLVEVNQSRFKLLRLNQNLPGKGIAVHADKESFTGYGVEGEHPGGIELVVR